MKVVIQALPIYLMRAYKLHVAIIQEIHSAIYMARFWWGTGEERKMHWLSLENMCKPKCIGGMRCKYLVGFNDKQLGKQVWCLHHYKDS